MEPLLSTEDSLDSKCSLIFVSIFFTSKEMTTSHKGQNGCPLYSEVELCVD